MEREVRERRLNDRVDLLLDLGLEIGLLTDSSPSLNSGRDYRILFRGRKAKSAAKTAEDKYFETIPELKIRDQAFDSVKDEFAPSQTRMEEFLRAPDSPIVFEPKDDLVLQRPMKRLD